MADKKQERKERWALWQRALVFLLNPVLRLFGIVLIEEGEDFIAQIIRDARITDADMLPR